MTIFAGLPAWDKVWLAVFVLYMVLMLYLPLKSSIAHALPPASSIIILMEQVITKFCSKMKIIMCNRVKKAGNLQNT